MSNYEDCDPEDYEPDFRPLRETREHTARKAHQCNSCDGLIAPGQRYKTFPVLNEGRFEIVRFHADNGQCHQAALDREEQEKLQMKADSEAMDQHWNEEAERISREGW